MKILFTNDDGYDSYGLRAVADLFKNEHDILVVAPVSQRSAYSHAVSIRPGNIQCKRIDGYPYPVYAVSGTPVDCVKIGITSFGRRPDLVVSGINDGRNLGADVLYSGTVSAACDAAYHGIKAVALSLYGHGSSQDKFLPCAYFFKNNFDRIVSLDLPRGSMLNINFPIDRPKGVKIAGLSMLDSYKNVYEPDGDSYVIAGYRDYSMLDPETDEAYCRDGYITLTPILADRTDRATLAAISKKKFDL